MRKASLALATAFLLAGCATSSAPPPGVAVAPRGAGIVDSIDPAAIDAALKPLIGEASLAGVSALVEQDGREAYFGAFGMADREAGRPFTRDTLVQIYSMTKPITGVALMTLYDQGKFKLDDPVVKYIPEFTGMKVYAGSDSSGAPPLETPRRAMTILDLMRHTAGLSSGDSKVAYVDAAYAAADPTNRNITLSEEARRLAQVPLVFHPGERWEYSPAVDMQALLIERLSGEPFDQYLQEHVLTPLKMTHTMRFVPEALRGGMAVPYEWHPDGPLTRMPDERALTPNTQHWTLTQGSAGLVSTIDDYMRFARMLLNDGELDGARILKPSTVRLMSTNQLPAEIANRFWLPSKGRVGFGLDFAVRTAQPQGDEAAGSVGEFFWDGYLGTLFWVDPINRITAVLFVQYVPFGKVPLHKAFRDAVYRNAH